MRIIISIEHPAWAHQFRQIIKRLEQSGHVVKVLAIQKDHSTDLLDSFGIPYEIIATTTGSSVFEKAWLFALTTVRIAKASLKFKPDVFIGRASPMMAINSFLFRKPHVIYEDTQHAHISLFFCRLFSTTILTDRSFTRNLGSRHKMIDAYKELFYLHPNVFAPDWSKVARLGITPAETYFVVRFVAWTADHDFGQHGFSYAGKKRLLEYLSSRGKVFISSELPLPEEFRQYECNIQKQDMHHLLYYATIYIGEGGTMASEAAVLGTPAIFVNTLRLGYLNEQETKYGLTYSCSDEDAALAKAQEWLSIPDLKAHWQEKRQRMLRDKIDVTEYMVKVVSQSCSRKICTQHRESQIVKK